MLQKHIFDSVLKAEALTFIASIKVSIQFLCGLYVVFIVSFY